MELRLPSWLRRRSSFSRFGGSGFANSTLAEIAWQRARNAARRWGIWGAIVGAVVGMIVFAPASWLARGVAAASGERVLLADAQGSVWTGSAQLVLAGGPGSRDASVLPGRVNWELRPAWNRFELRLRQPCCLERDLIVQIRPGLGTMAFALPGQTQAIGQWPAAWLSGLGTPFNTLQLGGAMRLSTTGVTLESAQGRWRLIGSLDLDLLGVSSRLSTLDTLGSYRLGVRGGAAAGDTATVSLDTLDGALRLSGSGQWAGSKMRFRGEASAAQGQEAALNNLLNIIGRRQGAVSVISIG
ncbi:MAG: type II secretion system protein N [Burkholderiaceae bacterium]